MATTSERLNNVVSVLRELVNITERSQKDFKTLNTVVENFISKMENIPHSAEGLKQVEFYLSNISNLFNTLNSIEPFDTMQVKAFNTVLAETQKLMSETVTLEARLSQASGGRWFPEGTGPQRGSTNQPLFADQIPDTTAYERLAPSMLKSTLSPAGADFSMERLRRLQEEESIIRGINALEQEGLAIQTQTSRWQERYIAQKAREYEIQKQITRESYEKQTRGQNIGAFIADGSPYLQAEQIQAKLAKTVEQYGMKLSDVTSIQKDQVSGMTQMTFQSGNAETGIKSLGVQVDRLGQVNTRVGGSFRNLGDQIAQSISQFAKFMVSATLIYGVLNAVSEQIGVVIDNETELANIAVVLGQDQEKLNQVFNAAADAANVASESINGVLEGYQQAIRATGNVADETERLRQANIYMTESLVLSKLSTLEQAKSMDILVAALRQSNTEIDDARDLLDRWVAVTKIANVDMRTLAESYAIVGTVAKSAGIEVGETNNELVGLIAVLAEQTQLTATETGNALRAVITGLGTDEAITSLRAYGIAVTDVSGEMRDFFDIATEINQAFKAGLISESQLSQISRAIGGGVRRQPQVEVILKNLDRVLQINAQSANQYGTAQEALEIQTDTFKDAVLRLSNAFQELAQTWGSDGGLLDLATGFVKALTEIIDLMTKLSSFAGPGILGLLAVGGISAFSRGQKRTPFEALRNRVDQGVGQPITGITGQTYTQGQFAAGGAMAGLGIAGASLGYFGQGENKAGFASIGGGIAGAAIAALTGNPQLMGIGASLGATMAGGFVSELNTLEGDLVESWRKIFEKSIADARGETPDRGGDVAGGKDILPSESELFRIAGRGNELFGKIRVNFLEALAGGLSAVGTNYNQYQESQGLTDLTESDFLLNLIKQRYPEEFKKLAPRFGTPGYDPISGMATSQYTLQGEELVDQSRTQIADLQRTIMAEMISQMASGELSSRQLGIRKETLGGIESTIAQVFPAVMEDGMVKFGDQLLSTADAIDYFADTYVNARSEEQDAITLIAGELRDTAVKLEQAKNNTKANAEETAALEETQSRLTAELERAIQATHDRIAAERYQVPGVVGLPGEFTQAGMQEFIKRLVPAQEAYEEAVYSGSKEALAEYQDSLGPILLQFENQFQSLADILGMDRGFDSQIISDLINQLQELPGMFQGGVAQNAGFMNIPLQFGSEMWSSIMGGAMYQQLLAQLQTVGYTEDLEDTYYVSSNNIIEAAQRDNTIIQMLLSQIEENTSDMVDGIYNLPTDSSFYVPFQGYEKGFANAGGVGAGGFDFSAVGGFDTTGVGNTFTDFLRLGRMGFSQARYSRMDAGIERYDRSMFEEPRPDRSRFDQMGGAMYTKGLPDTAREIETAVINAFSGIGDTIFQSVSGALDTTPIRIAIDISAFFETVLDGEIVASSVKKYLTEEMVRKGDSTGSSITAVI